MARDLEAAAVGLLDHGRQVRARDPRVDLEPGRALVRPVADDPPRLLGIVHDRHVQFGGGLAHQVWPGHVDARSRQHARIDRAPEVELGVGLVTPGRADRRDARAQVELGGGLGGLHDAPGGHVERVIVEPHDPGNHRVPREIQHLGAGGNVDVRSDRLDHAVADDDRRVRDRLRAGAVH